MSVREKGKEPEKKVDSVKNEKLSAAIRRPSDSVGAPSSWGGVDVSHYIGPPFLSPPGYRKIDCGSQK